MRFFVLAALSVFIGQVIYAQNHLAKNSSIDEELREELKIRKVLALPTIESNSLRIYDLGRALFHDRRLSGNGKISCASCHQKEKGLSTATVFPQSIFFDSTKDVSKKYLPRNAPSLYNLAFQKKMFWDGRVQLLDDGEMATPEKGLTKSDPLGAKILTSLRAGSCLRVAKHQLQPEYALPELDSEGCVQISHIAAQTLFPLSSVAEMRGHAQEGLSRVKYWTWLMDRLLKSDLKKQIQAAFPEVNDLNEINIGHLGRALAEYLTLEFQTTNSPLDRYIAEGDDSALSQNEKEGALVFFSDQARCTRCHVGPLFTDHELHSVAIPQFGPGLKNGDDFGGHDEASDEHFYAFKTPSLRNLSITAPYMHNGAFLKLNDVLSFYNDIFQGLMKFEPPKHPAAHLNFTNNKSTYVSRLAVLNAPVREPLGLSQVQLDQLEIFLLKSLADPKP